MRNVDNYRKVLDLIRDSRRNPRYEGHHTLPDFNFEGWTDEDMRTLRELEAQRLYRATEILGDEHRSNPSYANDMLNRNLSDFEESSFKDSRTGEIIGQDMSAQESVDDLYKTVSTGGVPNPERRNYASNSIVNTAGDIVANRERQRVEDLIQRRIPVSSVSDLEKISNSGRSTPMTIQDFKTNIKRINTGRKPNSWEPEGGLQESDGKVKKAKIKGWDHLIGKDFSDKKKSGKKKIVTDKKKKSKLEKERSKTDDMVKTMTEKIRIKSRKKNINETLERMK